MNIHLIQAANNFVKLPDNAWESGPWQLNEIQAEKLAGGEIYFHKKRTEPSFYGGTILGYRVDQDGESQGGIIFKLQYSPSCRNVSTDKTGWSKGAKITELEQ
jgi:hypothetical protein